MILACPRTQGYLIFHIEWNSDENLFVLFKIWAQEPSDICVKEDEPLPFIHPLPVNSSTWFYQSVEITHRKYWVVHNLVFDKNFISSFFILFFCDQDMEKRHFLLYEASEISQTITPHSRYKLQWNSGRIHQQLTWQTIQYLHQESFYFF